MAQRPSTYGINLLADGQRISPNETYALVLFTRNMKNPYKDPGSTYPDYVFRVRDPRTNSLSKSLLDYLAKIDTFSYQTPKLSDGEKALLDATQPPGALPGARPSRRMKLETERNIGVEYPALVDRALLLLPDLNRVEEKKIVNDPRLFRLEMWEYRWAILPSVQQFNRGVETFDLWLSAATHIDIISPGYCMREWADENLELLSKERRSYLELGLGELVNEISGDVYQRARGAASRVAERVADKVVPSFLRGKREDLPRAPVINVETLKKNAIELAKIVHRPTFNAAASNAFACLLQSLVVYNTKNIEMGKRRRFAGDDLHVADIDESYAMGDGNATLGPRSLHRRFIEDIFKAFPANSPPPFILRYKPGTTDREDPGLMNEAIVGLYALNALRDSVPNFYYVYASYQAPAPMSDTTLYSGSIFRTYNLVEYVPGVTLRSWIQKELFSTELDASTKVEYDLSIIELKRLRDENNKLLRGMETQGGRAGDRGTHLIGRFLTDVRAASRAAYGVRPPETPLDLLVQNSFSPLMVGNTKLGTAPEMLANEVPPLIGSAPVYAGANNFDELYSIYFQIILALECAFRMCRFSHGNLTPDAVVVRRLPQARTLVYDTPKGKYYLETSVVAVLVDFSHSRAEIRVRDDLGDQFLAKLNEEEKELASRFLLTTEEASEKWSPLPSPQHMSATAPLAQRSTAQKRSVPGTKYKFRAGDFYNEVGYAEFGTCFARDVISLLANAALLVKERYSVTPGFELLYPLMSEDLKPSYLDKLGDEKRAQADAYLAMAARYIESTGGIFPNFVDVNPSNYIESLHTHIKALRHRSSAIRKIGGNTAIPVHLRMYIPTETNSILFEAEVWDEKRWGVKYHQRPVSYKHYVTLRHHYPQQPGIHVAPPLSCINAMAAEEGGTEKLTTFDERKFWNHLNDYPECEAVRMRDVARPAQNVRDGGLPAMPRANLENLPPKPGDDKERKYIQEVRQYLIEIDTLIGAFEDPKIEVTITAGNVRSVLGTDTFTKLVDISRLMPEKISFLQEVQSQYGTLVDFGRDSWMTRFALAQKYAEIVRRASSEVGFMTG